MKTLKGIENEEKRRIAENYKVLDFLKQNKDKVFTRDDIKKEGLYPDFEGNIDRHKFIIFGYEGITSKKIDGEYNYYYEYDLLPFHTLIPLVFLYLWLIFIVAMLNTR